MKRFSNPFSKLITRLFPSRKGQESVAERRRKRRQRHNAASRSTLMDMAVSWPRVGLSVCTILLLTTLLCVHLLPNRISWRLGDAADREIVATRTVRYEDTAATGRMREEAAHQVEDRYEAITGARSIALEGIRTIFDRIEEAARANKTPATSPAAPFSAATPPPVSNTAAEVVAHIGSEIPVAPEASDIALLLRQKDDVRQVARSVAEKMTARAMDRGITVNTGDLRYVREQLPRDDELKNLSSPELREAVAHIVGVTLTANRRVNTRETERERESARAAVPMQMRRLSAGTIIVRPTERVTQVHLDQFAALGLQANRLDAVTVATITLLVTLLTALASVYLRQFHRDLYEDTRRLLLLCILSVISVLGLKIGSALLGISSVPGVHFGYLGMMCVASAGMVIALLLSPRVGLLTVALLSVASGLALNNELRFTVITLGSSLIGIVCVSTLKNRGDLMRATLFLCAGNALLNVLIGQLEGDQWNELLTGALWGVVSGVFAVALFYFGVAAFEKPFGITTHLRLLELTDPATPILQEFRLKVPGTYAHSLMVSNLAHAAAEDICADALLVRVAAYYHDLGKMNRPEFFVENQSNAENIHDRIAPSLSAIILASHVKEGVEIAREIGLPPLVIDLIQQHHGTTLMKYFYHRATGGLPDPTLEAQFRYAGPKPQTKEAAILMIADSVEAASRTLTRPTPTRIADFVARIIEDKRADGQLDECDLTLKDLRTIHEAMARTLSGALHARIEYPSGTPATSRGNTDSVDQPPPGVASITPEVAQVTPGGEMPTLVTGAPITEDGDSRTGTPGGDVPRVGTRRSGGAKTS